jgi:hypothetical protein
LREGFVVMRRTLHPVSSDSGHRGSSLVEIVLVLLVLAIGGAALSTYLGATKQTLESVNSRPVAHARIMADLSTLAAINSQVHVYYAANGQWPPSREALAAILRPAPQFQCAGNDYTYDPLTGAVRLVIMDPGGC